MLDVGTEIEGWRSRVEGPVSVPITEVGRQLPSLPIALDGRRRLVQAIKGETLGPCGGGIDGV